MFERKKRQNITAIAVIAILGAMLVFVPTIGLKQAYAVNDANGIQLKQPFATYTLTYPSGGQHYESDDCYDEQIGIASAPDSMRHDFVGEECASMDSVMMAGYFKMSPGTCINFPGETISAELNGGPHTSNGTPGSNTTANNSWADTIHVEIALGTVNGHPQDTRVRLEPEHPDTFDVFAHNSQTTMPPNNGRDLCTTTPPTGSQYYVGFMAFKVNLDGDCDGVMTYGDADDKVSTIIYVDTTGFSQPGNHPRNNWELAWKKEQTGNQLTTGVPNGEGVKSAFTHWVNIIGHPDAAQQTIRIDNQDQTDWSDGNNNFYLTAKEVTALKNGCTAPQGGLKAGITEEAQAAMAAEEDGTTTPTENDNTTPGPDSETTALHKQMVENVEEDSSNTEDNTTDEDNNNSEEDKEVEEEE